MRKRISVLIAALSFCGSLTPGTFAQLRELKDSFALRITKVKRTDGGCRVKAESAKARYELSSSVAAACAMLKAGETYRASRVTVGNDEKDESKDSAALVVINTERNNTRRPNALFDIESEESR